LLPTFTHIWAATTPVCSRFSKIVSNPLSKEKVFIAQVLFGISMLRNKMEQIIKTPVR
jgi:hypothetical protein